MTMPPPPGQGGFPPGYGQQPDSGYPSNNPGYPGGYTQGPGGYPGGPQYPIGPPGGGPQYPGGYGGPGGFPGPPGPPPGNGGRGPLVLTLIGGLVVVGGVIAALVFLMKGDDDKKDGADGSQSPSTSVSASKSPTPTASSSSPTPTPTRTTARPTTPAPTSTSDLTEVDSIALSAGDCINLNEITGRIEKVSCTSPHDKQVFKNFDLTGSTYPSDAEMERQIEAQCGSLFDSMVAKEPNPRQYGIYYRVPQQGSWDIGDKEATCMLQDKSDAKISKKF